LEGDGKERRLKGERTKIHYIYMFEDSIMKLTKTLYKRAGDGIKLYKKARRVGI
jgi:hypothetical protein